MDSLEPTSPIRPDNPPTPIPVDAAAVPELLRELARWVCWRNEWRDGKWTKVPYDARTGRRADITNPATWSSFEEAAEAYLDASNDYAGVGFVFAANDPFTGIDLDECIVDGALVGSAQEVVDYLDSYTEISPSGKGVKIFIIGRKPEGCGCKSKKLEGYKVTEIYSAERFFTVTGNHLASTPLSVENRQSQLEDLCGRLWPKKTKPHLNGISKSTSFDGDDEALIELASNAKNGSRFSALWAGDTSAYANDESAADLALCNHLAFYTGRDATRMDRLFRRSGLMRDKWDERRGETTYGRMTIDLAIRDCTEVYSPRRNRTAAAHGDDEDAEINPTGDDGLIRLGQRDPDTGRLVLSPKRTLPTADAYVRVFNLHADVRTLHGYGGLLMEWRGNRYSQIEDEAVKHRLQPWLHESLRYVFNKKTDQWELVPFESNPNTVKHAFDSIRTFVHLPATTIPPTWLCEQGDCPPALEILPCKSMNLHIPTGRVLPPTPALFTVNALDFNYEPNPEAPERWIKFLEQIFGDDLESVQLLQEWMGYCLISDTSQQKMLLIVGPRRSGKGTIGRVLRKLVGEANVAGPTTSSLAGNFGLQPLIEKSLAIVSDARFGGENVGTVVERLLCISGEDTLTIDRKFLGSVTMKLPTRFVFLTNELPRLNDASTALAGRFLVLRLSNSFYGKEDVTLTEQLISELPGILLWAIEGWKRLKKRGHFVQPKSSEEAIRDLEDLASPVSAFVRECCVVGAGHRGFIDDLYTRWKEWCEHDGRTVITHKQSFGRDLAAAIPGIKRRRGTGMASFYDGIGLAGGIQ